MQQTNTDQKYTLCWGMLYHMLGLRSMSQRELKRIKPAEKSPYYKLREEVRKYEEIQENRGKRITAQSNKQDSQNAEPFGPHDLLKEIVKTIGTFLDPKPPQPQDDPMPKLGSECDANRELGKANDSFQKGYSRDPFKKIEKEEDVDNIALAAICYLLRGHALFFYRPRIDRDFNAAKTALNDFHQAYQLTWRLYHGLKENHQYEPDTDLSPYLSGVRSYSKTIADKGDEIEIQPGRSCYFIWNLFLLCEIFRGNVYKQIDYIEGADRFYRHAQKRFSMIYYQNRNEIELSLNEYKFSSFSPP